MRRFALIIVALSVLLVSVSAHARSYRKNRKHKGLRFKQTKYRVEKVVRKKKKVVKKQKRGPMALGAFERFRKERILENLKKQIATLSQIIGQTPVKFRADLYFRLAEHYWEVAKYYDFVGHKYDDYRGRPSWPEKKRLQAQAWAQAKIYRRRAAAQYFKIIKGYPEFNRLCEAYYFLGKNLFDMGQEKKALGVFRSLIAKFGRSYPKCPFIPNAYLAFGEHYFNAGQVRTALKSYQQVLHFRNSTIYAFALYKVAWCYYNLVRYRSALTKFVAVVQHARQAQGRWGSASRRLQLLKEALRDLVLAYSQVGEASQARTNFYQWGGEGNYLKMLRSLGGLYREQGKNAQVIALYTELLQLQSGSPRTMFYQLYITQAIDKTRGKADTIRHTFKLVKLVKQFRGVNAKSQLYVDANKEIQPQLKEFATFRHYEAQKSNRKPYYADAVQFYNAYLALYDKGKDAEKMRFFYAEILFKLNKYERAAKQYTAVLVANPKSKFALDSAYNPVLAYNKLMKKRGLDVTNVGSKRGQSTAKKALPPIAKKFLQACETFLKYFKKGERAIDVSYKAAQLYYYFNHFDKALPRFYFLVKRFPRHEYAIYSAHYILDVYNIQEKWVELNKWAWKFYKMPGLGNPKFKREVRDLIVQSGIKTCDRIDKSGKSKEAADCYMKFATEFPRNKKTAAYALYKASYNYYRGKNIQRALNVRRRILTNYPKSKYVKESMLGLAKVYAERANFQESAQYYEMYLKKYKRDKKRPGKKQAAYFDAMLRAATFREANGNKAKAIDHYNAILNDKNFRNKFSKEYVTIYFKVAKYYKKQGNYRKYARKMKALHDYKDRSGRKIRRFFAKGLRLHARMEHAMALKKLGSRKKAEKIYSSIPRLYDRLPETQKKKYPKAGYAAAHVRFMEAEKLFNEYAKIRLSNRMNKRLMLKTLQKKDKALNKAWKSYGKVVKYRQGHWGVAAYYRAGDISLNYANFLYKAPTPSQASIRKEVVKIIRKRLYRQRVPGRYHYKVLQSAQMRNVIKQLVERTQDNYRNGLRQRGEPYERKAAEFYVKALRMAHRLSVYNVWTQRALVQLAKLDPYGYPRPIEKVPGVGFQSSDFTFSKKLMGALKPKPSPPPAMPAPKARKTSMAPQR